MSSAYAVFPPSLADRRAPDRSHDQPPHTNQQQQHHHHIQPTHLSPYASTHARSASASPILTTNTPADSVTSVHYQSSDYSDLPDDPFFGVDFNATDGNSPSFLDGDQLVPVDQGDQFARDLSYSAPDGFQAVPKPEAYQYQHPISPDQTPSLNNTSSPHSGRKGAPTSYFGQLPQYNLGQLPQSVSPQELTKQFQPIAAPLDTTQSTYQLTPVTSGSGRSSEDGLALAPTAMPCQSPRVTVSTYDNYHGGNAPAETEAVTATPDLPTNIATDYAGRQHGYSSAATAGSTVRDDQGRWLPNEATGHEGIDPDNRPSADFTSSVNDLAAQRKVEKSNQGVRDWLTDSSNRGEPGEAATQTTHPSEQDDNISTREISLGGETENKFVSGHTYFPESGAGEVGAEDVNIMRANRNWADGPMLHRIQADGAKHQPDSSQAAIEKFERLCRDTDSVVSRAATWGTRRRSLPSVHDFEGVTSGSFLKKLTLSRGENRRPSILGGVRDLLKKPSTTFKRSRAPEDSSEESSPRESRDSLAPPTISSSGGFGGKKQSVPSINTALVSLTNSVASVGATHVRGRSVSKASITSPKSPSSLSFAGLGVKSIVNRRRSGSELAGMWKKAGGPPVALPANPLAVPDQDDDDDDDDDMYDDSDMMGGLDKTMDDISPNIAGFREHLLKLNPGLVENNNHLVDRIAHQQIIRYKGLLNARVKHLKSTSTRSCPCGSMCIAQGGSAKSLEAKNDPRVSIDPLSARYDGSDENTTPREGALNQDTFPLDIPIPPTVSLPAEFECQLCFQAKKFQKPSDWTKHVHEDVQPFTCTWERCRDPKIFKRKADWVRHENEGHRHLEWWQCDVDECQHICYRRDNFLQHLVREHKFLEPKVKTKAAIKRAGTVDPTWQMVEKCHKETPKRPQEEPCRFCSKTFPTWKKLTVHLAKHMESISLPVLRLVARKELDTDTIISPVQEPPPRSFNNYPNEQETPMFGQAAHLRHAASLNLPPNSMAYQNPHQQAYVYNPAMVSPLSSVQPGPAPLPPGQFTQPFYAHNQFPTLDTTMDMQVGHGYAGPNPGYNNMPVTTNTYIPTQNQYSSVAPGVESFPAFDINAPGLQGLQDNSGNQAPYDNMMGPSGTGVDQYGPQGNVSPFSHSPNQGQGGFYNHGQ